MVINCKLVFLEDMNENSNGPIIESRHHKGLQPKRKNPIVFIALILFLIVGVSAFFLVIENEVPEQEFHEDVEAQINDVEQEEIESEEVPLEENQLKLEDEKTVDFYYERALEQEKNKDYEAALKYYGKTISKADRYSAEMWISLSNGGIIKAQRFKNYKGALKDFNQIIEIETNRINGEINEVRLESGYINRAYVKNMMGNNEGACDDLYEALGLGIEESVEFIEEKINKVCL